MSLLPCRPRGHLSHPRRVSVDTGPEVGLGTGGGSQLNSSDGPHGPHGEHTHVISDEFVALWVVPGGSVVFLLTDDIIHFLPLNLLQVIGRGQRRW